MDISRRSLIKGAGIFSLLCLTGYLPKGLCYYSAREDDIFFKKRIIHNLSGLVYKQTGSGIKTCFIETGGTGYQISDYLQRDNNFERPLFSKELINIYEFLHDAHLIILIGSIEDQDFWVARKLAIAANPRLIITLTPCDAIDDVKSLPEALVPNEGLVLLPHLNTIEIASKIIQDFYSCLYMRWHIIPLDFADVVITFSGGIFIPKITESMYSQAFISIKLFAEQNKRLVEETKNYFLMLSFKDPEYVTIEILSEITEHLHKTISNDDAEIIWTDVILRQSIADFRATSFISLNHTNMKANAI